MKAQLKTKTAGNSSAPGSGQKLSLATGDVQLLSSVSYNKCKTFAESLLAAGITACLKDQQLSIFSIWCCKIFRSCSNHIGFRYLYLQEVFSFLWKLSGFSHTDGIYRSHCITNTPFFCRFIIKESHTNNHLFFPRNLVHLILHFTSSKNHFFSGLVFPAAKEIYFDVKGVSLPCWANSSCSTITSHKYPNLPEPHQNHHHHPWMVTDDTWREFSWMESS